jgi:hypothetical protein
MEIVVSPPPPGAPGWARLLLVLAVCLPVTALALLPICFSLDRYVVTGDDMDLSRGTLLIERSVPVSDLGVGDVVTFPVRRADGVHTVVRRVVAVHDGQVRTAADAAPAPDPWTLDQHYATLRRVAVAVPFVGYGFLAAGRLGPPGGAALVALGGLVLVAAAVWSPRRRRRRAPGGN